MTPRRRVVLGLVVAVVVVLAVPATGSFSAASIERPVALDVAPEGDGALRVAARDVTLEQGATEGVVLFDLANRVTESVPLAVEATVVDGGGAPPPKVRDAQGAVLPGSGGAGVVTADVVCGAGAAGGPETVEVRLTGTAAGVTVELTRTVEIECETPGNSGGGPGSGGGSGPT